MFDRIFNAAICASGEKRVEKNRTVGEQRPEKHGLAAYPIPRTPIIIVGGTIYRNYTGGAICFSIARELARFSTSLCFFFVFPSFEVASIKQKIHIQQGRGFRICSIWREYLQVELFREIRLDCERRANIQVGSVSRSTNYERLRHCTLGGS